MIEFTARDWRKVWERLYNSGDTNVAGRIAHDLGHVWNSDDWDTRVSLDFDSSDREKVVNAAADSGVQGNW